MLHIGITAWNMPELLKAQGLLLKKFLRDDFKVTVADNSEDNLSERVKHVCAYLKYSYVKTPKKLFDNINASSLYYCNEQHAVTLNWLWDNVLIKDSKADTIGFLDHDILPTAYTSIEKSAEKIYGYWKPSMFPELVPDKWYMCPTFLFFNRKFAQEFKEVNFGLAWSKEGRMWASTGGAAWWSIYSKLPISDIRAEPFIPVGFAPNYKDFSLNYRSVELASDWVHLSSPVNWDEQKKSYVGALIKSLLES